MGKGWDIFLEDNYFRHIMPHLDSEEHEFSLFCKCAPDLEILDSKDAGEVMVNHHAYDCRELTEERKSD